MTGTPSDFALYAVALLALFLTPGPVWVALMARAASGGFAAAWPLAIGVVVGDVAWPFLAILGVTWMAGASVAVLEVLKWVAAGLFLWMGVALIRQGTRQIPADGRLTRPGRAAGFAAGVAVILGNPKAILFYMGALPGFFDLRAVTAADIAVIVGLSAAVPLAGNLALALSIDRLRALLTSPRAMHRMNVGSGTALIGVAAIIPFT
jgi:threonine/homoserine/homoserine lactone efflux protein